MSGKSDGKMKWAAVRGRLGSSQDSDTQQEANLESADPELCIRLLQVPTVLTCVNCVRAVMNSSAGIHFIIDNEGYIRKLSQAFDTSNHMVKKQTASAWLWMPGSLQGREDAAVSLQFVINALIFGTDDLRQRDKMRKQFIGLQLLDVLPKLREEEDEELIIQWEAFEEAMSEDEEELLQVYGGIDMSDHLEVFTTLFNKVSSTPASMQLLSILQTLLLLGPDHSDIWQALESITNRAILLAQDSHMESSEKIMQRLLFSKGKSCRGQHELDGQLGRADKGVQTDADSGDEEKSEKSLTSSQKPLCASAPPPPPPLTPSMLQPSNQCPPPPPPLPGGLVDPHHLRLCLEFHHHRHCLVVWVCLLRHLHYLAWVAAHHHTSITWHGWRPTTTTSITWYGWRPTTTTSITWYGWRPTTTTSITWYGWRPPPPPPLPGMPPPPPPPGMIVAQGSQSLGSAAPTKAHRCPTLRMKKLNWQKLRAVTDGHSMWATVQGEPPSREPNYSSIEQLFSFPVTENKDKGAAAPVKKEPKEITFIDPKKNLNLNIFLKQFKCKNEDFCSHDSEWRPSLPESHEIANLKSFQGDKEKLANVLTGSTPPFSLFPAIS
ncbi:hypothetical protein KUCAC02_025642 [Chaenocephalus aceratus]|uniref:Uncharacterized protein n=1 Tax=Chaenocephalus aceratus TaxID=36190 RepID=A0ACB9VVX2_CHAAC|nr:hypothetical protein KUCAC02_025642 [Chaenocephalus aceratus]